MSIAHLLTGLALLALGPAPTPVPDLDVAIPPGAPQHWGLRFPAITPPNARGPSTPGDSETGGPVGPGRTAARPRRVEVDVPMSTSTGLLRIITHDLASHLEWVLRPDPSAGGASTSGSPAQVGFRPAPGDGLYWAALVPLLRHLLHPAEASALEVSAHLVELGTPTLVALEAAEAEDAFQDIASDLRKRLHFPVKPPSRRKWPDERAAMLGRWVRAELLAAHPYDPEGGFGRHLFLLSEQVEPAITAYLDDEQAPLRRAAASALGRYRTQAAMEALARAAADTKDDVLLARACSAIGGYRSLADPTPLLKRLRNRDDDLETVLLVEALARTRNDAVVLALVQEARRAEKGHPALLVPTMSALAQLWHPRERAAVIEIAEEVSTLAARRPAALRVDHVGPRADRPDGPDALADLVLQLATLVRARVDPEADDARAALLALVPEDRSDPKRVYRGGYPDVAMAAVHPRARMLYLDVLADMGPEGTALLRRLAEDRGLDPALRGPALARLPSSARVEVAEAILSAPNGAELCVHALEVLAADRAAALEPLAGEILEHAVTQDPAALDAPERYLLLVAVRALSARGALDATDLIPLLPHTQPRLTGRNRGDAQMIRLASLIALVDRYVDLAAARAQKAQLRKEAEALIDAVQDAGYRRELSPVDRGAVVRRVSELAVGAKGHAQDFEFKRMVTDAILAELIGFNPRTVKLRGRTVARLGEFEAVVPLAEELLFALSRTGDGGVQVLAHYLADSTNAHRGAAAVALTSAGTPAASRALVRALVDDDPFVRLCSYEGLRKLTGEDHFCDWIYGAAHERALAAGEYMQAVQRRR